MAITSATLFLGEAKRWSHHSRSMHEKATAPHSPASDASGVGAGYLQGRHGMLVLAGQMQRPTREVARTASRGRVREGSLTARGASVSCSRLSKINNMSRCLMLLEERRRRSALARDAEIFPRSCST